MNDTQKLNSNNTSNFIREFFYKMNDKKNQTLSIHFNFMIEILLKMNHTKSLQFYKGNPFKN